MIMKYALLPVLLILAIGCSNDRGTNDESSAEGVPTAPVEGEIPASGSQASAKGSATGRSGVNAGPTQQDPSSAIRTGPGHASGNDMASENAAVRKSAARAISAKLVTGKSKRSSEVREILSNYAVAHTREFLGLFNGDENLGKADLSAWAEEISGAGASGAPDAAGRRAIDKMILACTDCTQDEREVLGLFVTMANGGQGKGGK